MTENLWNRYDISRKSPEVPARRSPKVVRKDRELSLNAPWDSTAIIIIIIIINEVLFYSDTVMNNITGALYTISGKNNETKPGAAG